jgi:hypothetical protein
MLLVDEVIEFLVSHMNVNNKKRVVKFRHGLTDDLVVRLQVCTTSTQSYRPSELLVLLRTSNPDYIGHRHTPVRQGVSIHAGQLRSHHFGQQLDPFGNQQRTQGFPPRGLGAGQVG